MDGNKDEALKCLKIGKQALKSGDQTRALKFIKKANRLDPNLLVDDILLDIEGRFQSQPSDESSSIPIRPSAQSSTRHRVPSNMSSTSTTSGAYTEEQIEIVRQIKKKKDFYEILGVERTSTVDDVRKAYRKLSLKVHPDKNSAPGAEEAFKSVSKAFQCLNDEESRKRYDIVGSEEPVHERHASRHDPNGFNGFYSSDVDADEIFRNFFFGGMPSATTQFRGFSFGTNMRPTTGDNRSGGFNLRALIQLLPVIVLILLNFLPSSEPIYALSQRYPYENQFVTQRSVNYYVRTRDFEQKYPPESAARFSLEREIESDYVTILSQNCQLESQRYRWGYVKEMPHCDMLRRFQSMV